MKSITLLSSLLTIATGASDYPDCTLEILTNAQTGAGIKDKFNTKAAACAEDISISTEQLYAQDIDFTDSEFKALATSANCKEAYGLDALAFEVLNPPCYVNEFGYRMISSNFKTLDWDRFLNGNASIFGNATVANMTIKFPSSTSKSDLPPVKLEGNQTSSRERYIDKPSTTAPPDAKSGVSTIPLMIATVASFVVLLI
ncbi:hypothetical protein THRCLA_21482 [Thraustotheca clavata]|uniref:Secreted protein n=1 Tax=Thraustotheca clavata TaxID=74557 RepID=A0A1V9ZW10_9STRA|nr:hypothetical protein THRCLA_21482 [Thraustotheca clavata]